MSILLNLSQRNRTYYSNKIGKWHLCKDIWHTVFAPPEIIIRFIRRSRQSIAFGNFHHEFNIVSNLLFFHYLIKDLRQGEHHCFGRGSIGDLKRYALQMEGALASGRGHLQSPLFECFFLKFEYFN